MTGFFGITIVIPAYNYAKTLGRAVLSVLPQLDKLDELLVINDGSTDDTAAVLIRLEQEHPGRFKVIHKTNGGLASVRNLGIERARNDWLIFLDADDELSPQALARIRAHLAEHPETRLVIGGHCSVDECGRRKEHLPQYLPNNPLERVKAYLLDKTLSLSNGASVMHRSVFARGNYPERFRNAEDIPVFAQALATAPVTLLPSSLALIHKHSDSLRHDLSYSLSGGIELVDEVFGRLPTALAVLRGAFYQQRCLSLFRDAYLAGNQVAARHFYCLALRHDWRTLTRLSYTRKALRLWLGRR